MVAGLAELYTGQRVNFFMWLSGGANHAPPARRTALWLAALAALAILPYVRVAELPFISDDYIQIFLGWKYGAVSGWRDLALDPLYRCRSTSLVMSYWTWRFFDLNPLAYYSSSILLHVFNTWLVFGLGAWRFVGWRLSALAAGFFAVFEGHQEAVIWYAALPELLVFFFSVSTFLLWILWLQSGCARWRHYLCALAGFFLALASKESSVVIVPLLFAATLLERAHLRRALLLWLPFVSLAVFYALSIHASRSEHLFYHDGTFSLTAFFLKTLTISTGRLFWVWGYAGLLALLLFRPAHWMRTLSIAAVWIVITFLPYSFLTYMPRVPSRHTYLASAGLALIVAAGALALRWRMAEKHPWALPALATLLVVHNCGYVLTRKHAQFKERAEPTEKLLNLARRTPGTIYLHCFPYGGEVAELALEVSGVKSRKQLVIGGTPPPDAESYCLGSVDDHIRAGAPLPSAGSL